MSASLLLPGRALRRLAVLLTAVGLAAGLTAAPASAAPGGKVEKAIWGQSTFMGKSQFPIYRDLGVDLYQYPLDWRTVASGRPADATNPNDPLYIWPKELDDAVAEAARYKIDFALMVSFTPLWANGGQDGNVPPTDPQDYAQFVEAVAKRYPSIKTFILWGEPIRRSNYDLHTTEVRNYFNPSGSPKGNKLPSFTAEQKADAREYAELVDATYARLKKLSSKNRIVAGNTTTSGDVDPFNWAKWVRLADGKPPRMDEWGHNPFGTRGPDLKKPQIVAGTADFSDLDVYIPWVKKYIARSGRNKKLKIFLSEYNAPTDVPSSNFTYFVTRALQAKWLTAAFKISKASKDISTMGWFGLRDEPVVDGKESRIGLIDNAGKKKPSYYAFKRG